MSRFGPALVALALLLAACAARPTDTDGGEAAADRSTAAEVAEPVAAGDGLTAVATVFPLAWLATQIAPGADVTFLGSRGQDPHDLELSPGDRELLETADLLVYMGELDFQPQVETAAAGSLAAVVDVARIAGRDRLRELDHDDEDEHAEEDEDDHAQDDEGAVDPHVWFDAGVMAAVAEEIGATLASLDAGGAEDYEASAAAVAGDLRDLDEEIDALLSGCRHQTAFVSHEAYDYLLAPRDLSQEGISGAGGHSEASPQRLAELTQRIREADISAVAVEPFEGRADAETLAAEAGVGLVDIEPLEVVTDADFELGYLVLLRQQAEAFAAVLECEGA